MSSHQPDQSCGRRDRAAWGQFCCPRPPSRYGTGRIGSDVVRNSPRSIRENEEGSEFVSECSYLEEVGTLLSIACKDASAMCILMSLMHSRRIRRPPFVAKLLPCANCPLSSSKHTGSSTRHISASQARWLSKCTSSMGTGRPWRRIILDDVRGWLEKHTGFETHFG